MTPEAALAALNAHAVPGKAAGLVGYHKVDRPYLGVAAQAIDALCRDWRAGLTLEARLALAAGLWDSNVHEARIAAAKLLTQARIRPDGDVWALIASCWVPQFDGWAVADAVSIAGQKRLVADPARLDEVEHWATSPNLWTRRAALVMTLPWTKQNHPKPQESAARDRILGWAAGWAADHDPVIQKALAQWLRDLSRHAPARTDAFLADHGTAMKPWAVREAAGNLP
ncbi:MAG: DNA alkylation repair protein [Rhodobacterales bacterium]|nr:DNA alkylation repair protein [Rhodobacterales bacterium]